MAAEPARVGAPTPGHGARPQTGRYGTPPLGYRYGMPPPYGTPPMAAPLPGPSLVRRIWPAPVGVAPARVLAGIAGTGVLAGLTMVDQPGVQWPVVGAAAAAVVVAARRGRTAAQMPSGTLQAEPPAFGAGARVTAEVHDHDEVHDHGQVGDLVLGGLAVALLGVAALRTGAGTIALCLLAALGLGAAAALGARTWPGFVLTPAVLGLSGVRGLAWSARGTLRVRPRAVAWPVARGVALAVVVVWVAAALLSSADDAFAGLLSVTVPDISISVLPFRVVVAGLVGALVLALACGAASRPRFLVLPPGTRGRTVSEWLLPVVALSAVLALFFAVQAAELFDRLPASLVVGDATPAERARHGFSELVAVTLLAIALLAWAGRRTDPQRGAHRRLLAGAGGVLLVMVLVLVASAIRRLWLYEQTFGWTVLRLQVGMFELWLGAMLVLIAVAWLLRRTAVVPRLVVGSAGAALLVLGVLGPEALVASWNVDRFEATQKIDVGYLAELSDDAVPALSRLPEPLRSCVLRDRSTTLPPWYAANLSRIRAVSVLRSLPSTSSSVTSSSVTSSSSGDDVACGGR